MGSGVRIIFCQCPKARPGKLQTQKYQILLCEFLANCCSYISKTCRTPHYTDLAYKVFGLKVVMHSEVEMLCISDEVVCCMKLVYFDKAQACKSSCWSKNLLARFSARASSEGVGKLL